MKTTAKAVIEAVNKHDLLDLVRPEPVWVLIFVTDGEPFAWVFHHEKDANDGLWDYVCENWNYDGPDTELDRTAAGADQYRYIDEYFDANPDKNWYIQPSKLE